MKNKLKIAIFSGTIPSTSFIERLINGVSQSHEVLLFGVQKKQINYKSSSVKIYTTPQSKLTNGVVTFARVLKLLMKQPKVLFALIDELKTEKSRYSKFSKFTRCLPILLYEPDVLHIQWAKDLENYSFLKTRFHIPIILSLRGAHVNYSPIVNPELAEVYKQLFPHVDAFHAVSNAIAKEASKYENIIDRTKVIHSPMPDAFLKAYLSFKKSDTTQLKMVSVGRHHWKKGYKYAFDAIAKLKEMGHNIQYTIIGPSEPDEALRFQMHQLNISDNIVFKGHLYQIELLDALKQQHILLLPSLEEGIANVVLEAMAIGLPVISTDCGGMAEVVIDKKTGWLIPMRNPDVIVNAVINYKNTSEEMLNEITKAAHQNIKVEFDEAKGIAQFNDLYESVSLKIGSRYKF